MACASREGEECHPEVSRGRERPLREGGAEGGEGVDLEGDPLLGIVGDVEGGGGDELVDEERAFVGV